MAIELSVSNVREELLRAGGAQEPGSGASASMLLGRVFHEVFADLVSGDPERSGLKFVAESGAERAELVDALADHAWRRLVAPRLLRHAAVLQACSEKVVVLWRATQDLVAWFVDVVHELFEHGTASRSTWEELQAQMQAEVSLSCELRERDWSEPVRLVGIADSLLHVPGSGAWCAIELKLGRATPVVDLAQAALYHLIVSRSGAAAESSALALMRFSPEREEHIAEAAKLGDAQQRLVELIGKLAGVVRPSTKDVVVGAPPIERRKSPAVDASPSAHEELGQRLVRAFREQGAGVELCGTTSGPRFLRFEVRLLERQRVAKLESCTREIQHRLELQSAPMVINQAGRLYIDVQRPDPQTVLFSSIAKQLPAVDRLVGSAKIPVGVDAAGHLYFTDLATAGRSHALVAGTTGSGKSEWLRTMLAGLFASNTPDTLRVVTLDPKLSAFGDLEHSKFLWRKDAWWIPRANGRLASELFADLAAEMDRRYQVVHGTGSDNLAEHVRKTGKPMPRIVCVCDEYFALIAQDKTEKKEIEQHVALLGAKARAAGIHLVLALQQPSRAAISGVIQANLPCRVALALTSVIESRMILGQSGSERLTGQGDLLYKDFGAPIRLQAPYLPPEERAVRLRG